MPIKLSRTCDECKCRKVRCVKTSNNGVTSCTYCSDRGFHCHFSPKQKRVMKRAPATPAGTCSTMVEATVPESADNTNIDQSCCDEPSLVQSPHGTEGTNGLTRGQAEQQRQLYVDLLLENNSTADRCRNSSSIIEAHDKYVPTSGVAFFSEARIASISHRLGHTRLQTLLKVVAVGIGSRFKDNSTLPSSKDESNDRSWITSEIAGSYIAAFFSRVHPIYPFLVQSSFKEQVCQPQFELLLHNNPSFSALYHAVLALGCQHVDGGGFEAGDSVASSLFEHTLSLLPSILASAESLLSVQALVGMAIFGLNPSRPIVGDILISQAARMAQSIGLNKANYQGEDPAACQSTFWVAYMLEKLTSFACNRTSIIADHDIGTPLPHIPEATYGHFDWFHSMCRFSRLTSRAFEMIFSISSTLMGPEATRLAIDKFSTQLESWRQAIPPNFQPGEPFPVSFKSDRKLVCSVLKLHYSYYSVVIALSRLNLSLRPEEVSRAMTDSRKQLLNAARKIIELSEHIEVEAYTPIWLMGSMPLSALFILFDFIVHNPTHEETPRNMSLLGIIVGYFSRLELASAGSIATAALFDFVQIAREYVQEVKSKQNITESNGTSRVRYQGSLQPRLGRESSERTGPTDSIFASTMSSGLSLWVAPDFIENDFHYPMDEALPFVEGMFPAGSIEPMNFFAPVNQQIAFSGFRTSEPEHWP